MPSNQRPSFQNGMIGLFFVSGCRHYPRCLSETLEEAQQLIRRTIVVRCGSDARRATLLSTRWVYDQLLFLLIDLPIVYGDMAATGSEISFLKALVSRYYRDNGASQIDIYVVTHPIF